MDILDDMLPVLPDDHRERVLVYRDAFMKNIKEHAAIITQSLVFFLQGIAPGLSTREAQKILATEYPIEKKYRPFIFNLWKNLDNNNYSLEKDLMDFIPTKSINTIEETRWMYPEAVWC